MTLDDSADPTQVATESAHHRWRGIGAGGVCAGVGDSFSICSEQRAGRAERKQGEYEGGGLGGRRRAHGIDGGGSGAVTAVRGETPDGGGGNSHRRGYRAVTGGESATGAGADARVAAPGDA